MSKNEALPRNFGRGGKVVGTKTVVQVMKDASTEPDWTPMEALQWLKDQRSRLRFGKDNYQSVIGCIRNLMQERVNLNKEIELRDKKIARLQKLKTPAPYDAGGSGTWGV